MLVDIYWCLWVLLVDIYWCLCFFGWSLLMFMGFVGCSLLMFMGFCWLIFIDVYGFLLVDLYWCLWVFVGWSLLLFMLTPPVETRVFLTFFYCVHTFCGLSGWGGGVMLMFLGSVTWHTLGLGWGGWGDVNVPWKRYVTYAGVGVGGVGWC